MATRKNFYDDEYWKTGEGLNILNMRKLLSIIMSISEAGTAQPFLTTDVESDGAANWSAEWMSVDNSVSMHIEMEGPKEISIWAFNPALEKRMEFAYFFGMDEESSEYTSWDNFEKALSDARSWLVKHKDNLPVREVSDFFSFQIGG